MSRQKFQEIRQALMQRLDLTRGAHGWGDSKFD